MFLLEGEEMKHQFFEAVTGMAEIIWLGFMCLLILITAPVWLLPYTVFKVWQNLREKK
jgi:hypothetical protein